MVLPLLLLALAMPAAAQEAASAAQEAASAAQEAASAAQEAARKDITALAAAAGLVCTPALPAVAASSVPATAADAPRVDGAKGQQMVCRTTRETGSLAKSSKRCYTAEQWSLIENRHRDNAGQIQERNAGLYQPDPQ